jgi:hypothetical protein
MKKLLKKTAIALMLILPVYGFAQSPADALFDKYSGEDGYTSVYITQHMFELFADIDNAEDEEQFSDLVKDLKCIKILSIEKDSTQTPKNVNFYEEIMDDFPKQKYEELMVVKKKGQDIKFLIWKDGKIIKELLMIIGGDDDNALISIQGDINLKTISKLSKSMNIDGMENLENIDDE